MKILNKGKRRNVSHLVFLATLLVISILAVKILPTHAAEGTTTYTGWLSIIWGDSQRGESTEPIYFLDLSDNENVQLTIDKNSAIQPGTLLALNRQKVSVQGNTSLTAQSEIETLEITSISAVGINANGLQAQAVTGSQPFISIMCKFPDYPDEPPPPNDLAYFHGMYSSSYPGLDHYWREVSYNSMNIAGSSAAGWFFLPHNEIYYNPTDTGKGTYAKLGELAEDCIAAADPSVNFSQYTGINLMFNTDFDNGWAWGGGRYLTIDGVTKYWPLTWEPPWSYANIAVMSHEMGHAFGLPHSSGDYGQTYDNQWDVMSDAWSNCSNSYHATYGCLGQHTISYHKDILGWIPAIQKYTVNQYAYASITLEQLALPQTTNYKMVKVPIGGSSTNFYTVEVRRKTGYDVKLPGQAVIIHEVNTGRSRPAYVVDIDDNGNTGDASAMWTVGETFTDATNNITISVISSTSTGFLVTISNGVVLPPDNFHVTGSGQYSITLAWDDITNETGYKLYRKIDGNFIEIAPSINANTTSYTDQDVSCNTSYEYKLSLTTVSGESALTDAITGSTSSICPDPPSNDNFNKATSITSPSTTDPLDTREAKEEPDDPDLAGCSINGSGKGTVWYSYLADSDSAISLDTLGADYDTFIAVWTGTYPNLSLVACNDNASGIEQSQLAFRVSKDTVYYIEVGQP